MRAIVPAGAAAPDPLAGAEARLRETVDEVTRLDAELEALSEALADFSRGWERAVGDVFGELAAAERLVGRLQRLEDGLAELAGRLRAGDLPRRVRVRARRRSAGSAGRAARDAGTADGEGEDRAPPGSRRWTRAPRSRSCPRRSR